MKSKLLITVLMVVGLCLSGASLLVAAEEADMSYGHISFVDNSATVIRQDQTEQKAVVNLPIVPGDQVVTGTNGRCEIQFDNGTVLRLDKNTRLTVTTILAPTLTTRLKVTTLHLNQGQIYAMIQSYRREMFQVITPNAAIDFKQRSAAMIRLQENGDTLIFADKGNFRVKFGEDINSLKDETIHDGNSYVVSASHALSKIEKKQDLEFVAWNEYVNNHFKELHSGISKVPAKFSYSNKGIVHWAEKWSSPFGEWIYDDVFGYVWRPYDESFSYSHRPFYNAQRITINGKLFLVPVENWGWAPANMGTWVWMKWGWTWVPSSRYNVNMAQNSFAFNGVDFWVDYLFGNYYLYYQYRMYGSGTWRTSYRQTFHREAPKLDLNRVPQAVRKVIKDMNRASVATLKSKLGDNRPSSDLMRRSVVPSQLLNDGVTTINKKGNLSPNRKSVLPISPASAAVVNPQPVFEKSRAPRFKDAAVMVARDFNPDMKWAQERGFQVHYSSGRNAMVCGTLDSQTIKNRDRMNLVRFDRGSNASNSSYNSVNVSNDNGTIRGTSQTAVHRGDNSATRSNPGVSHKEKQ